MNAQPHRVLYFDDSPVNVEAARALGIAAYRVDGVDGVRRILRANPASGLGGGIP